MIAFIFSCSSFPVFCILTLVGIPLFPRATEDWWPLACPIQNRPFVSTLSLAFPFLLRAARTSGKGAVFFHVSNSLRRPRVPTAPHRRFPPSISLFKGVCFPFCNVSPVLLAFPGPRPATEPQFRSPPPPLHIRRGISGPFFRSCLLFPLSLHVSCSFCCEHNSVPGVLLVFPPSFPTTHVLLCGSRLKLTRFSINFFLRLQEGSLTPVPPLSPSPLLAYPLGEDTPSLTMARLAFWRPGPPLMPFFFGPSFCW